MESVMAKVYELMTLYLVDKCPLSLTNTEIVRFFVENKYTDYFMVQEVINDIVSKRLLFDIRKEHQTTYFITDEGKFELNEFGNKIPSAIIDEMNRYIQELTFLY